MVEGSGQFFLDSFFSIECDEYSTCKSVRDGIYAAFGMVTFEVDVLLGICGFVVNFCDNLAIFVFNEDV